MKSIGLTAVVSDSVLFAIDARVSFVACMDTSLYRAGGFAGAQQARLPFFLQGLFFIFYTDYLRFSGVIGSLV